MRKLILAFAIATSLFGQLTEADRCVFRENDDPAWAQPGYDDRTWSPRYFANRSTPPASGYLWERCTFATPTLLPGEPLAVQIRADSAWTVFVNGRQVGSFGDPLSGRHLQSSIQTRMIPGDVPAQPVLRLAIRYFRRTESLGLPAKPAIGTRASLDLRASEIAARGFQGRWLEVFANGFIFFAGIVLLILSGVDPARRDTFWLGMLCVGAGLRIASGYILLASLPIPIELWQITNWLGNMAACFFPWFCFAMRERPVPKVFHYAAATTCLLWFPALVQLFMDGDHALFFQWATSGHPGPHTLKLLGVMFLRVAPLAAFWPFWRIRRRDVAPFVLTAIWAGSSAFSYYVQLPELGEMASNAAARTLEAFVATPAIVLFIVLLAARFRRVGEERAQLKLDMKAAAEVQRRLIPEHVEQMPGFHTEAAYIPAREVGGDFYQIVPIGGSLLVVVGDVSGKGLDAAMLVATIIGALGAIESYQPKVVLSRLNRALIGKTKGGFVTCVCALIQPDGEAHIANAGHIPPYLGNQATATIPGLPLGIVPDTEYCEIGCTIDLQTLTFLSDGVLEAENGKRELFGFDRTRDVTGQSAQQIAEAARAWGQTDDITVVTVQRNAWAK